MKNLFRLVSKRFKNNTPPTIVDTKQFFGVEDLQSIHEAFNHHVESAANYKGIKAWKTTDAKTLEIAKKILEGEKMKPVYDYGIMDPPADSNQFRSIKVNVAMIDDAPEDYQKLFQEKWDEDEVWCVGGPAAHTAASWLAMFHKDPTKVNYAIRNLAESNWSWSAWQLNINTGAALNSDSSYTGHVLLPLVMKRNWKKWTSDHGSEELKNYFIEQTSSKTYKNVDFFLTKSFFRDLFKVYLSNEYYWAKNKIIEEVLGLVGDHTANRRLTRDSQRLWHWWQKRSGVTATTPLLGLYKEWGHTYGDAIKLAITKGGNETIKRQHREIRKTGVEDRELTRQELDEMFPGKNIDYGWTSMGHGNFRATAISDTVNYIQKRGGHFHNNTQLNRIFFFKEGVNLRLAGLEIIQDYNGAKTKKFVPCGKAFITLGYKVEYGFEHSNKAGPVANLINHALEALGIQPLVPYQTLATGVSSNIIVKKTKEVEKIRQPNGNFPNLALGGANWTLIAENNEYMLLRITEGARLSDEHYSPEYFLHSIWLSRKIFGDAFVGILSTYGCPRAVNGMNTCRYVKVGEDLVITNGKGGSGVMKKDVEAMKSLGLIGLDSTFDEVKKELPGIASDEQADYISDRTLLTKIRLGFNKY